MNLTDKQILELKPYLVWALSSNLEKKTDEELLEWWKAMSEHEQQVAYNKASLHEDFD